MAVKGEKRDRFPPVPDNVNEYLNKAQNRTLKQLMFLGWTIAFIRRPKFLPPTIVVTDAEKQRFGILLENGQVDYSQDFSARNEDQNIDVNFRKGGRTSKYSEETPCTWQAAYRKYENESVTGKGQYLLRSKDRLDVDE